MGDDRQPELTVCSVHEFTIYVIETIGFLTSDSGNDVILRQRLRRHPVRWRRRRRHLRLRGNDLIFGDQGKVSCAPGTSYDPDDPNNGVCADLGGAIVFIATNVVT